MKKIVLDFFRKGISACGLGPIILAILYLILQKQEHLQTLTVEQVCVGIFSLSALAFLAGGVNVLYQIERLPLMVAILVHGSVLYVSYLVTYLVNDWLEMGTMPILVFSGIFVLGYLIIWGIIYKVIKKRTDQVNKMLKMKQKTDCIECVGGDAYNGPKQKLSN